MQFDNHPPVNFESARKLAKASSDGGCYDGIGWDTYIVFQGKRLHLVHSYNSGCDYGRGTHTDREHMGVFDDREALIAFLLDQRTDEGIVPWWVNDLLDDLNYVGEEA